MIKRSMEKAKHTSKRESPEVADVNQPNEQCQAGHLPALEQHTITHKLEFHLLHEGKGALLVAATEQLCAAVC